MNVMKPVMYIFLNKGAGMSTGKSSAQAAHAAVEAFRISDPELVDAWYVGGHHTKIVLEARNAEHLITISHYLADRGFSSKTIIDEGRTEVEPHTITALGCAIVDKDDEHTAAAFGGFTLYRDSKPRPKFNVEVINESVDNLARLAPKCLSRNVRREACKKVSGT
jgi:peptidyl-tRNA hydrolase